MKLLKKIYCLIFGHNIVPMLTENEDYIYTKGCSICGCALGLPTWKNSPPPPNSTPEQIKGWRNWKNEYHEKLRQSCKK